MGQAEGAGLACCHRLPCIQNQCATRWLVLFQKTKLLGLQGSNLAPGYRQPADVADELSDRVLPQPSVVVSRVLRLLKVLPLADETKVAVVAGDDGSLVGHRVTAWGGFLVCQEGKEGD